MTNALTPDSLRPGDLVGPWRIEGYAGRGTYGVVYRARRAGHPGSVAVALKLALFAYDPRFLREVELLSRVHHPAVPELLDRGWWTTDEGCVHPYLVMQWVKGLLLYEWARVHPPTCRQVLQVDEQVPWRGMLLAAVLLLIVAGILWEGHGPHAEPLRFTQVEEPVEGEAPDAGTAGLGETLLTSRVLSADAPISAESIALEMPDQPLPGQQRAPCRSRAVVEINGGCWGLAKEEPPCRDVSYEWNGACYYPVLARPRPPTTKKPR